MLRVTFRERHLMLGVTSAVLLVTMVVGCTAPRSYFGRRCLNSDLASRTCHTLGPASSPDETCIPPGVDWEDGVTEDEAVAIALWNNAAYQELLAELGVTRADVIEAGQLTNPYFTTMLPVGVKQLEFALYVPLEAFWLRPRRLACAQLESQETGKQLVQEGLDLIRDVRVAYAELVLAQDRLRISQEDARRRGRIAELAEAGVRAGSASGLDASASRIDNLIQQQRAAWQAQEVDLAGHGLRQLLGIGLTEIALDPVTPPAIPHLERDVEELLLDALATRPDLRSAELAYEAARHRAKLARRDFLSISAMLPDANGQGKKGFEAGPGVRFTVPIFHQNQGAIARAEAEVEQAERHYVALCDGIAMEVRQAHTRLVAAQEAVRTWDQGIVPVVEDAVSKAEKAYKDGGTSLLLVLETTRRLLESQMEQAEMAAELRRAAAELERSVGRRLFEPPEAALAAVEESP